MGIEIPLSDIVFYLLIFIISIDTVYKGYKIWKYKVIKLYFPINLIMAIIGLIYGKAERQKRIQNLFSKERMEWLGINAVYGGVLAIIVSFYLLIESILAIKRFP